MNTKMLKLVYTKYRAW